MRRFLLSSWTAIFTLLLVLGLRIIDPSFVESVRLRYFDTLISNKSSVENNIVVVNIDEAALDKWGQWPFPRAVYAEIIQELYKRNAGLVVWNIMMPEKDRYGGDAAFSQVLENNPVVLANKPGTFNKNTPRRSGFVILNPEFTDQLVEYPGIIANIPEIENKAAGSGTIHTIREIDGINRRVPLIVRNNGNLYPALSMDVLRVAADDSTIQVKLFNSGVEKMRIPKFSPIATDNLGRVWIDWSQKSISVSVTNLPEDLSNTIVIVGVSAAGIDNPVSTAIGPVFPQDLQAAVIGTLINGVNIQRPDYIDGIEIVSLTVASVLLLFLTRWVYVGICSVIIIVIIGISGSWIMYNEYALLLDATGFAVGILLVSLHAYGIKFVNEFRLKQQIKKQFGTYLSPALVEKLQKNPELLRLGGETRELSIMFTDVRGFTTISEHYGSDVQGLTKIMNRYMTAMTAKIIDNNGTLDKYIGDAQMAFWNAPLDEADHAKLAVKTALEMLEDLERFNDEIRLEGIPAFGMGLGINTGRVVVGNMGSSQRFDYTCLGDSVNLAARLEGQSKPYCVKMILGERTAELVKDMYTLAELDEIAVKGKTKGVKIFTIVNGTDINKEYIGIHNKFLKAYRRQDWDNALQISSALKTAFKGELENYYNMMNDRIFELRTKDLSTDWDSIYRATSK